MTPPKILRKCSTIYFLLRNVISQVDLRRSSTNSVILFDSDAAPRTFGLANCFCWTLKYLESMAMRTIPRMWKEYFDDLIQQHLLDLKIYRSSHREWRNRMLHRVMIPVECWSVILLSMIVLPSSIVAAAVIALGMLSLFIATDHWIGATCLVFHVFGVIACWVLVQSQTTQLLISIGLLSWVLAWSMQVGVGHWLWERNQPNVGNIQQVSYLAMCQSVLIAWSS